MTVMNFDLEDGLPKVSFVLKPEEAERFSRFLADCEQAKTDAERLRAALAASCDEHRSDIYEAGPGGGCPLLGDAVAAERARRVRAENEVADAKHAMRAYARDNPRHEYQGLTQDPNGVHGWLARNDRPNVGVTGAPR